jgi:hypothetical protein
LVYNVIYRYGTTSKPIQEFSNPCLGFYIILHAEISDLLQHYLLRLFLTGSSTTRESLLGASSSYLYYSLPCITHKTICGKSPSKFKKELELRRLEKVRKCLQYRRENRQNKRKTQAANSMNHPDYGINCQKEDMEPDEYARQKQLFLHKMTKTADEIKAFERNTVLQSKITHGI